MIVITGASGTIGSKTAIKLLSTGNKVRVVGRNAKNLEQLERLGAEIFAGEMSDVEFLSKAFLNAKGAFLMLPPDKKALNFGAFQDQVGESQLYAVQKAKVKNIIFISSQGAHDIIHTGTVKGLGRHEIRLNKLPSEVNVLSIRSEGFMENLIDSIRLFNTIATPLRPNILTGLIASNDIAKFAAERLSNLDFSGKTHQDLLGNRDYTQIEIAEIIGKYLGKPAMKYVQLSYDEYKNALLKVGISVSRTELITERYKAINDGYFNRGIRNSKSTTQTSLEYFAETVLKTMFA